MIQLTSRKDEKTLFFLQDQFERGKKETNGKILYVIAHIIIENKVAAINYLSQWFIFLLGTVLKTTFYTISFELYVYYDLFKFDNNGEMFDW